MQKGLLDSNSTSDLGSLSEQHFCVIAGNFSNYNEAMEHQMRLLMHTFPVDIRKEGRYYNLLAGRVRELTDAVALEQRLKHLGYPTMISKLF